MVGTFIHSNTNVNQFSIPLWTTVLPRRIGQAKFSAGVYSFARGTASSKRKSEDYAVHSLKLFFTKSECSANRAIKTFATRGLGGSLGEESDEEEEEEEEEDNENGFTGTYSSSVIDVETVGDEDEDEDDEETSEGEGVEPMAKSEATTEPKKGRRGSAREEGKKWWEHVHPKAAGLSEEEFQKWRPFLDCYIFQEYDWSMEDIMRHGWGAIKFWRENAYPIDFGEKKSDEAQFAEASMKFATEQQVDEPEVSQEWADRLTGGEEGKAEMEEGRKEVPLLALMRKGLEELEEKGFPRQESFVFLRTMDIMKANRLFSLVNGGGKVQEEGEEETEVADEVEYSLLGTDLNVLKDINDCELRVLAEVDVEEGSPEKNLVEAVLPALRQQKVIMEEGVVQGEGLEKFLELTDHVAEVVEGFAEQVGVGAGEWTRGEKKEEVEPVVFTLKAPRDWPPPGWQVDPEELEFIHGGEDVGLRANSGELTKARAEFEDEETFMKENFPRYFTFLRQYAEWVEANKVRLDEESEIVDPAYYPGRRRLYEEYEEGMHELPFIEAGQYFYGTVVSIQIYEGIFVNIGAVHDAWVSVKFPDWIRVRDVISVGQKVMLEVIAKRDPWRYRFPLEARLVSPNIDELIHIKRQYPPIFGRIGDENLAEVALETDRPFPRISYADVDQRKPSFWLEERPCPVHPALNQIRERHRVEQELLDIEERDGTIPSWAWERFASVTDIAKLDLDAAREEREMVRELAEEAAAAVPSDAVVSGQDMFARPASRMEKEFEYFQKMQEKRNLARYEAIKKDVAIRLELGYPLEEWGRFAEDWEMGVDPNLRACQEAEKLHPQPTKLAAKVEQWSNWACDSSVTSIPSGDDQSVMIDPDLHWTVPS